MYLLKISLPISEEGFLQNKPPLNTSVEVTAANGYRFTGGLVVENSGNAGEFMVSA